MQKTYIKLEHGENQNKVSLECSPECSLGTVFDSICIFQNYIIQRMNETAPKAQEDIESENCEQLKD